MNRIDLIIDAIAYARACIGRQLTSKAKLEQNLDKLHEAMHAANELRDELYAKEMEQPTPRQSGILSITVNRAPWYKYATDQEILNEAKLRNLKLKEVKE
jgi:hypothetical protein